MIQESCYLWERSEKLTEINCIMNNQGIQTVQNMSVHATALCVELLNMKVV